MLAKRDRIMVHNNRHSKRGTSLVEVVIALFIFGLLVVLFSGSLMVSNAATGINGQYAQALSLCQHKIDQLRAVGYGRLTYDELSDAGIIDEAPTISPYCFTTVDGVNALLQLKDSNGHKSDPTTSITIAPLATDSRIKVVTVTVKWKSSSHKLKNSTATLTGYIANTE